MATHGNVRTHTRRTASGKVTTVRQHSRRKRGRTRTSAGPAWTMFRRARGRGLVSPRHAWRLARRAFRASRRGRRAAALGLGVLAVGELSAWLTLRGVFLLLTTAGLLALGAAVLAATATGSKQ